MPQNGTNPESSWPSDADHNHALATSFLAELQPILRNINNMNKQLDRNGGQSFEPGFCDRYDKAYTRANSLKDNDWFQFDNQGIWWQRGTCDGVGYAEAARYRALSTLINKCRQERERVRRQSRFRPGFYD